MPGVDLPDSPAGAFLSLAASSPETPCLFYPEGLDWRWWSRRDTARGVLAWAAELARHPRHPDSSRAAFLYRPRPHAVALDLALQAAGLVSMPLAEGPLEEGVVSIGGEAVPLAPWDPVSAPASSLPRPGGGAVVGSGPLERQVTAADLAAAAGRIAREVAASPRFRGRHEVLVSYRPLSDPLERALLSWAFTAGAAVLLEPFPLSALASTAWARPTLFAGTADEIRQLRAAAGRRRGLPFGRLRLILSAGLEPLAAEEAAFWEGRGVRVAHVDPLALFGG